jgi:hypothetical protein
VVLFAPFLGLCIFPPGVPLDVADICGRYWQRMNVSSIAGFVLVGAIVFNSGLVVSSLQQFTKRAYWRIVVRSLAYCIGKRKACQNIEAHLVTSGRYEDKAEYVQFLQWLDGQKDRQRVRSWDWFISNAYRSLDFLLFCFATLYLVVIVCALTLPDLVDLTVTERSWMTFAAALMLFAFLIPGDIHHYEVRADGDELLYREYRAWRKAQREAELS